MGHFDNITGKELSNKIVEEAKKLGADFLGIANVSGFLDESYQGTKPQDFMKDARTVIILGISVPKESLESLPRGRGEYTNTLVAVSATLRMIAFRLARNLEKEGYKAVIVPPEGDEFGHARSDRKTPKANISTKYAAYLSGLGKYGINHLLLTEGFGPRVRMTAIVTDTPLETGCPQKGIFDERCATCLRCVSICPAGALDKAGNIDRQKCADYMSNALGGLRCGLCVKVCPL